MDGIHHRGDFCMQIWINIILLNLFICINELLQFII